MAMHEDQLDLPHEVAVRLLAPLLPDLVPADVRRVRSAATTSHVLRVGPDLAARFPIVRSDPAAARAVLEAEHRAMAEFARISPFPTPEPLAIGDPSPEFPMPFSLQTWIPGTVAGPVTVAASDAFAEGLADLLTALRSAPTHGRSFSGAGRGGDLAAHDDWVQECLRRSRDLLPVQELGELWSRRRELARSGADVTSHRDLIPANLLVAGGRLTGVLDAGGSGPADPALDLVAAWHLLDASRRARLREWMGCSELEWERGAAWAFAQAIGLVWYYDRSNPTMAALGRSTLSRLLETERGDPAGSNGRSR